MDKVADQSAGPLLPKHVILVYATIHIAFFGLLTLSGGVGWWLWGTKGAILVGLGTWLTVTLVTIWCADWDGAAPGMKIVLTILILVLSLVTVWALAPIMHENKRGPVPTTVTARDTP